MIGKSSLKINFSWSFIGNLVFSLSQWLILIMLTKVVSVEEVGKFSYAVAFTAPFVLFLQFQLRTVQITDVARDYNFSHYFNLRFLTTIFSFVSILIISFLFFYSDIELITIIICVSLMKLADSISDIIYGLFQKHEKMKYVAISKILKSFLTIFTYAIILFSFKNVQISILAIVLMKILIIIFLELKYARRFENLYFLIDLNIFKRLLKISLPLGLMSTLMSIESNIPKYVLQELEGSESIAYFSALAYINMLGGQMITAVSQAAAPRLASYFQNNKKKFNKLIIQLTLIGMLIGVCSIVFFLVFGESFISILYNEKYAKHMKVFILIIISGAINYSSSFLGIAITSARIFKIQPYLGSLWVISSFLFSLIFISKYGLVGAAIALILTSIVKLVSKLIVLLRVIKLA
ncbi:oligosaccharide flippase family protein [Virgibacillus dokdonensis]|uniref:Polysaccharide biosynthesis protein n=1 Tax=Virgibacillus dokdonensis TaxID=302167 RepID=A0A2K9IV58_9BACI|nr:oligosaccharide flippase family protein [Virgibacillus dokdonensis]AUJ23652.1 Polysaccharide biosynthesis protein [Virgibacillus dokdonensis]